MDLRCLGERGRCGRGRTRLGGRAPAAVDRLHTRAAAQLIANEGCGGRRSTLHAPRTRLPKPSARQTHARVVCATAHTTSHHSMTAGSYPLRATVGRSSRRPSRMGRPRSASWARRRCSVRSFALGLEHDVEARRRRRRRTTGRRSRPRGELAPASDSSSKPGEEAIERRAPPPAPPPTCSTTTASGPRPIAVHEPGLHLQLGHRRGAHVARPPSSGPCTGRDASRAGCRAAGRARRAAASSSAHSATWPWNCGRSGWRGVGRQRRRHPVHPDVGAASRYVEDRAQVARATCAGAGRTASGGCHATGRPPSASTLTANPSR